MNCTYLTSYFGNKLPPFYIGSSTVENVNKGYRGSVASKEYKKIWKEELKNHPELFKIRVLTLHKNRKDASEQERIFQTKFNVVKNPLYINKAIVNPNHCFGNVITGKNNPYYGRRHTDEIKKKMSESHADFFGSNNPMFGKKRKDLSDWCLVQVTCPHCNKTGNQGGMKTQHFNNCKIVKSEIKISCGCCHKTGILSSTFKRWHLENCRSERKVGS